MTATYEVVQRLEALEMAAGMNTAQTERLLTSLNLMAEHLAQLGGTVEAIYEVLRAVAEHLEQEGEPDA